MNKSLLIGIVVAAVVFALATTGVVHAQSGTPVTAVENGVYGFGGHVGMMGDGDQDGLLHDEMIAVFAEKLGLSVEELNARLAGGETLYTIATSQGLTAEEFTTFMTEARAQAIDQAVADGTLTQTQADWMKTRGNRMGTDVNGMRGSGMRGQSATGSCMDFDTNP